MFRYNVGLVLELNERYTIANILCVCFDSPKFPDGVPILRKLIVVNITFVNLPTGKVEFLKVNALRQFTLNMTGKISCIRSHMIRPFGDQLKFTLVNVVNSSNETGCP